MPPFASCCNCWHKVHWENYLAPDLPPQHCTYHQWGAAALLYRLLIVLRNWRLVFPPSDQLIHIYIVWTTSLTYCGLYYKFVTLCVPTSVSLNSLKAKIKNICVQSVCDWRFCSFLSWIERFSMLMYITHVSSSMLSFVSHLDKKLHIDDVAEEFTIQSS